MTFAEKVLAFNENLHLNEALLPDGIQVMNPFSDPRTREITRRFYTTYYNDRARRRIILGINPGRFGAGVTGVPFTDTKRLKEACGIDPGDLYTHEPSSVFVYRVVDALGGPALFYRRFYINSVCPLGFLAQNDRGNAVNYNYYDDPQLYEAVKPFMIESVERQLEFDVDPSVCYCMGKGTNYKYLKRLNRERGWFDRIIPLEHPRFVVQYRSRRMDEFVHRYMEQLDGEQH